MINFNSFTDLKSFLQELTDQRFKLFADYAIGKGLIPEEIYVDSAILGVAGLNIAIQQEATRRYIEIQNKIKQEKI